MLLDKLIIGIYGRGGQGVITAAKIACETMILENKNLFIMLIPHYGPERTGGPVKAIIEASHEPIRDRTSLKQPTHLLFFDKNSFQMELESVVKNKNPLNIFLNAAVSEVERLLQSNDSLSKHRIILIEKNRYENLRLNVLILRCFFEDTKFASFSNLEKAMNKIFNKTLISK